MPDELPSVEEEKQLRKLVIAGGSFDAISRELQKSPEAVRVKIKRLGLEVDKQQATGSRSSTSNSIVPEELISAEEALKMLSKVGLNDAFLFLRNYRQLSDGQKYRYRIAKLIESKKQWWLMDEFAACLDRDTAKIIAFNLQKMARQQGKAVIAATTHSDLLEDLNPSVHVHKRFGEEISVKYYPNRPTAECSLIREMKIEQGTIVDWQQTLF